jgi:hypothetical protein
MPSTFNKQFSAVAAPDLIGYFGEDLVYLPENGAEGRPIKGIVERGALEIIAEIGDHVSQAIIVQVLSHKLRGILASEIDTGGDRIRVALRIGDDPVERPIVKVISDSGGFVRFAVQ